MRLRAWGATAVCVSVLAARASGQAPAGNAVNAESFAKQAMFANKAEVKLGELALQKAQSGEVKEFAQMMVKEHTNGLNTLRRNISRGPNRSAVE